MAESAVAPRIRGFEVRVAAQLEEAQFAELAAVPGVVRRGRTFHVPVHAEEVVSRLLTDFELRQDVEFSAAPRIDLDWLPRNASLAIKGFGGIREWVPGFMTDYQRSGVAAAINAPGGSCHLWWSAGSGKTLGAIVWALAWRGRVVTVTKAAVRGQWRSEIERFTTTRPLPLDGETGEPIPLDATWLLLSYDVLPAWIDYIAEWAKGLECPISVVFDESQRVKSHKRWDAIVAEEGKRPKFSLKGNQAAAAMKLSRLAGRRLATTATPIRDRVRDLWAQLDLVHPKEWGPYWTWARRYCAAQENSWGGMDDLGKSNEVELKERLAKVSHRVSWIEANRSLPPKRRLITYVRVDEQVRAEGIAKELKKAAREGKAALLEAQLHEAAARKRKRVVEVVEEALASKEKVVVFTGRRADCERLRAEIVKLNTGAIVVSGHGGDAPPVRDEARERYMGAPGPAVLVGTIDAWGEGLNLQDTDLLVVAMLPYTPGQVIQAEGRVARLGQTRPVLVHYLVAEGTVDERVAGILLGKLPAVEKVIESDEVKGMAREFLGADDEKMIDSIVGKIGG